MHVNMRPHVSMWQQPYVHMPAAFYVSIRMPFFAARVLRQVIWNYICIVLLIWNNTMQFFFLNYLYLYILRNDINSNYPMQHACSKEWHAHAHIKGGCHMHVWLLPHRFMWVHVRMHYNLKYTKVRASKIQPYDGSSLFSQHQHFCFGIFFPPSLFFPPPLNHEPIRDRSRRNRS